MVDGQMDHLYYFNLDHPNGQRSDGPSMLHQFEPSKWTTVHWTAYITLIWTVQVLPFSLSITALFCQAILLILLKPRLGRPRWKQTLHQLASPLCPIGEIHFFRQNFLNS